MYTKDNIVGTKFYYYTDKKTAYTIVSIRGSQVVLEWGSGDILEWDMERAIKLLNEKEDWIPINSSNESYAIF